MEISSEYIRQGLEAFSSLPGIGKKTALRLTMHVLKQNPAWVNQFCASIEQMKSKTRACSKCNNLGDDVLCSICSDTRRRKTVVCVVENMRDIISVENTQQFNGLYHVLGGLISPLDGIGPDQLSISALVQRVRDEQIEELLFALSPNIQGDTTVYYIHKQLSDLPIQFSTIARGIAFGGEIEYADELTLARSISNRMPIDRYMSNF